MRRMGKRLIEIAFEFEKYGKARNEGSEGDEQLYETIATLKINSGTIEI